jgi:hypothetical protein
MKCNMNKKQFIISIAVLVVVVAAYFVDGFFREKMGNFMDSKFPEVGVVSAAITDAYPERKDIFVGFNMLKDSSSTTRSVIINLVNSDHYDQSDIKNLEKISCSALVEKQVNIDRLVINSVTQKDFVFFHFSSTTNHIKSDCKNLNLSSNYPKTQEEYEAAVLSDCTVSWNEYAKQTGSENKVTNSDEFIGSCFWARILNDSMEDGQIRNFAENIQRSM